MGELVAFSRDGAKQNDAPIHCTVDLCFHEGVVSYRIYGVKRERADLAAIAVAMEAALRQIKGDGDI